jgi:fructose-1,6-bisphosphatase/sedoheptulose 1,7-bisphosphatase-like protein
MEIGRIGVWLGGLSLRAADEEREVVRELERRGFGAVWFGEGVGTRESFAQAATLLAWTSKIVVATGISGGDMLRGVRYMADGARTHSLVLCSRCNRVRFIDSIHLFSGDRHEEIRL